ncbi:DMT family transporter [Sneathiella chinensis]|uniref:Membrane protein n=1 Tax=Sneathiella chinensis TaxID=349750 RepID=A0ABQ5U0V1_9PROT|nr:DMT family transporter [Sneathiella chinensis]GLQ04962.1 membrane protein [Sneathiella chinensis]
MSNKAQPIDMMVLVGLSLMWSSSFVFIKIAVETITPLSVATGRIFIAAVVLYLVMKVRGLTLPTDLRSWIFFLLIGIIGNALPFFLISWAELTIDSSVASILIAAAPLASFLIGHFATTDERLTLMRTTGVLLGFAGIIVMIGPEALLKLGVNAVSQLAIVAGATCYVTAGFIARKMPPLAPETRGTGVLVMASVITVPICLVVDQPWTLDPSLESLTALVAIGIFPTAMATLMLFFLIIRVGATFVALNNYINPVLGVVWGYLLASEIPTLQTWAGLLLILGGLIVTQIRAVRGPAKVR